MAKAGCEKPDDCSALIRLRAEISEALAGGLAEIRGGQIKTTAAVEGLRDSVRGLQGTLADALERNSDQHRELYNARNDHGEKLAKLDGQSLHERLGAVEHATARTEGSDNPPASKVVMENRILWLSTIVLVLVVVLLGWSRAGAVLTGITN